MRKEIEGKIEIKVAGNDYYFEWLTLDGKTLVDLLNEFEGLNVRITIETLKEEGKGARRT